MRLEGLFGDPLHGIIAIMPGAINCALFIFFPRRGDLGSPIMIRKTPAFRIATSLGGGTPPQPSDLVDGFVPLIVGVPLLAKVIVLRTLLFTFSPSRATARYYGLG